VSLSDQDVGVSHSVTPARFHLAERILQRDFRRVALTLRARHSLYLPFYVQFCEGAVQV
jgi:hypothetical protein